MALQNSKKSLFCSTETLLRYPRQEQVRRCRTSCLFSRPSVHPTQARTRSMARVSVRWCLLRLVNWRTRYTTSA